MDLVTYLTKELERRNLSQRQLAKDSGLSHPHIGNVLSRKYDASADFCVSVARALDADPVYLLSLAGHWPKVDDAGLDELTRLASRLSPDDRAFVLRIARTLAATGD